MLGAIIGDIVGSVYEFHNIKTTEFDLFNEAADFTDDTVLTVAVADALMNNKTLDEEAISKTYQKWCRRYPGRGYGGSFSIWMWMPNPMPYNSKGNGCLMRISPVAWLAKNEEEVKKLSRLMTNVTHNTFSAKNTTEILAMCIYYLRKGKNKEYITKYLKDKGIVWDFDINELRKTFKFSEICTDTLPQAICCFMKSNSFEDCLRLTVSIGGDTDTLCAVSCALAEAYYGIPKELKEYALSKLPEDMKNIYKQFNETKEKKDE